MEAAVHILDLSAYEIELHSNLNLVGMQLEDRLCILE